MRTRVEWGIIAGDDGEEEDLGKHEERGEGAGEEDYR